MYFALLYDYVEDVVERRAPYRDAHLTRVRAAAERGELLLGGAFSDAPAGAILAFKVDKRSIVEDFARNDPYVKNGLVTNWHVRDWNVVVGSCYDAQ